MNQTIERQAVHIAAVVMQRDGLCLYKSPTLCKKVSLPDETGCIKCIESWLLSRAKRELKKKGKL